MSYIYESPDNGKTGFARKSGETQRTLHYVDPTWKKEQELAARWFKLKGAVFMADSDPTLNNALTTLEMLYALKKNNV